MLLMRTTRAACVAAGSLIAFGMAGAALAQATDASVEHGRQLYMKNGCYSCHGTVGQGGERSAGPRIAPETYPFEAFKAMVRHPRDAMPRYEEKFISDEQLQAIHAYVASVPKGPQAKDIAVLGASPR